MIIDSPIVSGSYAASGSFNQFGDVVISGSLTVTGSIIGTASLATTASFAATASYAANVPITASYALSASQATTASYLSGYVSPFPFTGSAIISGSLGITGSLSVTNFSGSGVRYLVTDASGSVTAQTASAVIKTTQAFTATAGQTTFAVTNGYSTGYVDVFINGSKLNATEFTDTSGTNIVLATGSFENDVVEVVKYLPASGVSNNVLRQQTVFTASAGQTVFSASYTPGLLDIFLNGAKLAPDDYTANNGTTFTLTTASIANDILDVFVYSYQVGSFSGIGGVGTANQLAYFGTTNSITGSPNFTVSGSAIVITGSLIVSSSSTFTNIGPTVLSGSVGVSGSLAVGGVNVVLSNQTSSLNVATASFAATASSADNFLTRGTLTAQTIVVQTITSSIDWVTGSAKFGSINSNAHTFTGSVAISGSSTFGLDVNSGSLYVSASGFIGIGTTVPAAPFHIRNSNSTLLKLTRVGAVAANWNFIHGDSGGAGHLYSQNDTGNNNIILKSDGTTGIGNVFFSPSATLHVSSSSAASTIFRVDTAAGNGTLFVSSSGNVGIGTTNPVVSLDVNGYGRVAGIGLNVTPTSMATNPNYIRFTNTGGDNYIGQEGSGAGGFFPGSVAYDNVFYSTRPYNFILGGTSTLYVNTSNNVGIGTTSVSAKLHVSGTTGGVFEVDGASAITALYVSASGNIGIGNTNPQSYTNYVSLTIGDNSASKIGLLKFRSSYNSGDGAEIYQTTGGTLQFAINGSTGVMSISGSRIGINTASPSSSLHVNPTSAGGVIIGNSNNAQALSLAFINDQNTSGGAIIALARNAGQFLSNAGAGDMIIGNSTGENILFGNGQTGTTEYMRITSGGNVGIGTTSPNTRLTIFNGGANTSTNYQFKNISVTSGFFSGYTGTAIQSLLAGYDGSIYGTDIGYGYDGTGYALMFSTNDNTSGDVIERVRITSNGNVGINTSSPLSKFHVDNGSVFFRNTSVAGYTAYIGSIAPGNTGDRYLHVQFNTIGSMMLWIKVFGYVYTTNVIEGLGGGYVGGGTGGLNQAFQNGAIVAQYQNSGYVEIVVDTVNTATTNRWGSITFLGGTDNITTIQPLEIRAYSWTSTTTRVY